MLLLWAGETSPVGQVLPYRVMAMVCMNENVWNVGTGKTREVHTAEGERRQRSVESQPREITHTM